MPSHFSSIGFPAETRNEFAAHVLQAAKEGTETQAERGSYVCWTPGAGVQLWAQISPKRGLFGKPRIFGCNPHFAGTSRVEVNLTAALPDLEHPLDGSFHAWADPGGEDGEQGAYPFVFDAPNFDLTVQEGTYPRRARVQIAAFAEELTCYADGESFTKSKTGDSPGLAPEAFILSGLFVEEGERPRAAAVFVGRVLEAERRTNPATGAAFHWLSVRTLGGVYDVVADLSLVREPPGVGGIVRGSFWLSGRLAMDR